MIDAQRTRIPKGEARLLLLEAARDVIRTRGYSATTVDQICAVAGVSKGAFFHHFENKEALGIAAARYWSDTTSELFEQAPYHKLGDPLDRLIGYVDFRKTLIVGPVESYTCLVGTMAQEIYNTHPELRKACEESIFGHAQTLVPDIASAIAQHSAELEWTALSLAIHIQAVIQGSFIISKASGNLELACDSIDHLKLYLQSIFGD